jgi:hypothetical protein
MSVIARGGEHQPPEYIERKVCGECGIVPPYCNHDRAKLIVERYVPADQLAGAVEIRAAAQAVVDGQGDWDKLIDAARALEGVLDRHPAGGQ